MWKYIAGFIDCDGSISKTTKKKYKYVPFVYSVVFTQHEKYQEGMKQINDFLNLNNIKTCFKSRVSKTQLGTSIMWNITIKEKKSVLLILNKIKSNLIFKKELAIDVINYLNELERKCPTRKNDLLQERKKYWSDNEVNQLKQLINDGYNYEYISTILHRNYTSIVQKIKRLNK